jgi:integrase/recombinase XerD
MALYRKHLEARLLTPSTVMRHMFDIGHFVRWLADRDLRDVTLQTLLDYHAQLHFKRNAPAEPTTVHYRNRQMRNVVNFFHFLHERGKILIDPAAEMPVLHSPKRLPRGVLTNAQVLRMLAQPNLRTANGFRDRTIMEVLYSCGLRGREICLLTIYDIDLKALLISIRQGKGKKDRITPLGSPLDFLPPSCHPLHPCLSR